MQWRPEPNLYPRHLRARIARGLGVGDGADYKAWRNSRNSGTKGTSSYILGIHIPRIFNFLNEKETTYFYLIERDPINISIREHWPILDLPETLRLCSKHNIKHPAHDGMPEPFVVDFLITERGPTGVRYKAASINPVAKPMSDHTRRRLKVQQQWCEEHGISWVRIDTAGFSTVILQNLRFIRSWYRHRYVPDETIADNFASCFQSVYRTNVILSQLVATTGRRMRLSADNSMDVFRYCAWSNHIGISLQHRLQLNSPLVLAREDRYG